MVRKIFGAVHNVLAPWWSSNDSLPPKSSSVLHLFQSRLPHETTLYHTKLLRASARSVSLCPALLSQLSSLPFSSSGVLCRALPHSLGASRHRTFPQLNLHRAHVRRNHGRLPSHGFIERAPEHRARVIFFLEARASDKALTLPSHNRCVSKQPI